MIMASTHSATRNQNGFMSATVRAAPATIRQNRTVAIRRSFVLAAENVSTAIPLCQDGWTYEPHLYGPFPYPQLAGGRGCAWLISNTMPLHPVFGL